jgi:uncharacterized membrane protein
MTDFAQIPAQPARIEAPAIRRIGTSDVIDALKSGWRDFMARPSHVIFLVLIYPLVGLLLGAVSAQADLLPLFFPLVAGFALLGPFAAIGLYEVSRRRERGEKAGVGEALQVLRSPSIGAIAELALLLTLLFVAWLVAAMAIYRLTIGEAPDGGIPAFVHEVLTTAPGWTLIVAGHAVGLVFAALAFCLGAVSFPLLVDRPAGLGNAIATSFRAVLANPAPMALWAVIIAALMMLGSLPFFIGLAVVLPVLGHATWHLYRKLVA